MHNIVLRYKGNPFEWHGLVCKSFHSTFWYGWTQSGHQIDIGIRNGETYMEWASATCTVDRYLFQYNNMTSYNYSWQFLSIWNSCIFYKKYLTHTKYIDYHAHNHVWWVRPLYILTSYHIPSSLQLFLPVQCCASCIGEKSSSNYDSYSIRSWLWSCMIDGSISHRRAARWS